MVGLLATILEMIHSATWDFAAYYGLPERTQPVNLVALVFFAILSLVMLGDALLARWWLRNLSQQNIM
jgi:hypothetical protein